MQESRPTNHISTEEPENASFDGEWEVVEEALAAYDRRHNWFVGLGARTRHAQLA